MKKIITLAQSLVQEVERYNKELIEIERVADYRWEENKRLNEENKRLNEENNRLTQQIKTYKEKLFWIGYCKGCKHIDNIEFCKKCTFENYLWEYKE